MVPRVCAPHVRQRQDFPRNLFFRDAPGRVQFGQRIDRYAGANADSPPCLFQVLEPKHGVRKGLAHLVANELAPGSGRIAALRVDAAN